MTASSKSAEFDRAARPTYPVGVPSKFSPDGDVQHFPGNTVLARLNPSSELYASMLKLSARLSESHLSSLLAILPPSSWHMTVFEGVCDQVRKPGFWPSDISIAEPLEGCTQHLTEKLAKFGLRCKPPYRFTIVGFNSPETGGISVHLEPHGADEEARLRGLRDRLSNTLQIRHPQHDSYQFHIGLAYLLRHLTEQQKTELTEMLMDHFRGMPQEVELGGPEFCTFENMCKFDQHLWLG